MPRLRSAWWAARARGVSVEAELGMLGGVEEDIVGHVCLTDPQEAKKFVELTKCDSLAVAIGTSHGAYKFKAEPGKKLGLHFEVIEAIQKLLPGYPMVMHGSSSVPKDEVERINKAGGKMLQTSGVPEEDFLPAAKMGVCMVNIDTDGRLVWSRVHREFFRDQPDKFDLRDPGKIYIEEYAKLNKRSWEEYERIIDKLLKPEFGTLNVKEIARSHVRSFLRGIAAKTRVQANRAHACLRKIFNWAIKEEIVDMEGNPASGISRPGGKEKPKDALAAQSVCWNLKSSQKLIANSLKPTSLIFFQLKNFWSSVSNLVI
jgi:hypothetical protein